MGGADAVVFTGGIGENSPKIRAVDLRGHGMGRSQARPVTQSGDRGSGGENSTEDSPLLAYAIPTDEELLIARDTVRVILGESPTRRESGCQLH